MKTRTENWCASGPWFEPLGHEVRSCAALGNRGNRRDSATFVFVTRVIVWSLISSELHLSVFGTETISSDNRSIDISDTL